MPSNVDKSSLFSDDPTFRQQVFNSVRHVVHDMGLPESVAEDIYQAVLTTLSDFSQERMDEIENFNAYVSTMARNEAIRFRLKNKHLQVQVDADQADDYSDQFEGAKRVESNILLREIWMHLNSEERDLLQLMIFGYTANEMANRLGITHVSARQRISRLRLKLRELIF